jgi:hypothetical protein
VHPKFALFPPGVTTATFTEPGPEITPVVSVTFNWVLLTTVVLRGVVFTIISDDETKSLPFTFNSAPRCTSEKLTVLGAREPTMGAGRALPHRGFKVLLQPERINSPSMHRKGSVLMRKSMGLLLGGFSGQDAQGPGTGNRIFLPCRQAEGQVAARFDGFCS